MTASYQKIFSANPRIGFLSFAQLLSAQILAGKIPAEKLADTRRIIFNQRLDAAVTAVLALMILALIADAIVHWHVLLAKRKPATLHETPYVATAWGANYSGLAHGAE
jgi:carbon starvation protein